MLAQTLRHTIGSTTRVIDAEGRYLVPGLLDGHMHVESGMLTVTEFVRAVLPHGTTGMFVDPHEIANVFGLRGRQPDGRRSRLAAGTRLGADALLCAICAGFRDPRGGAWPGGGGRSDDLAGDHWPGRNDELSRRVQWRSTRCCAEMAVTRQAGKVIGGHYPSPDLGLPFHGYVAGGPEDDHEGTRLEDAVARVRQGMRVMLRYGSAWQDVAAR